MKKTGIAVLITVIVALFIVTAHAEQNQDVAILSYYEGDVQLKLNDESDWGPVEQDIALQKNDMIKTGPDGKARIVLEDESVIVIGPLSLFKISFVEINNTTGKKNSGFYLEEGMARAKVSKLTTDDSAFTISTPTAVAGVRGTEFAVESLKDKNITTVTVFEGAVEVGDRINKFKNAVMVLKEQATDVTLGEGAARPRKVDMQRLKKLRQKLSNANIESGGDAPSASDKKAAAVIAIKRSGLGSEKEKELVHEVKNGNVPAEQIKTVLNLKAQGASDTDVNKALDVVRNKNVDPQTVKKLYQDIKNKGDSSAISEAVKKFEEKSKKLDDRPEPPSSGTAPAGASQKPPASGAAPKPNVPSPGMKEKIKEKIGDAKNNIDDRKNKDGGNQGSTGDPAGVKSKEKTLIERAKQAHIPKKKLEQLIRSFKEGKLDFADVSLIIDAAARGVDIHFIEKILGKIQKTQLNVKTKRLLLNAVRFGMAPEQVKAIFEKIKLIKNNDVKGMTEIEKQLKAFIKTKVNQPVTNTGANQLPGTAPPGGNDNTTSAPRVLSH